MACPSALAARAEYHGLGGLRTTEMSLFAGLELGVQDQGVSRVGSILSFSLRLADGCLLTLSSHGLSATCTHIRMLICFYP